MRHILLLVLLSTISYSAFAINDFKCVVKEVYKLDESGKLITKAGFVTPDVGSTFIVNRQSGQITGEKITNTMSGVMPKVYDVLPSESNYKAVTVYLYTIDYIEIQSHKKSKEKPFVYKGAFGEVITGLCTVS
ncbi:hypothetical protein [Vibrio ostreicida]|uniref:hypothetical protein n=1 Tax=Vibrio ostreicida TaxID=526588 RepID=UPI0009709BA8|nr:hypothetical protein [Vibrio ostreicida]